MEFKNESNSITLDGALPQEDDDALINNKEYEFSVTNNGTLNTQTDRKIYLGDLDNEKWSIKKSDSFFDDIMAKLISYEG